MILLTTDLSRDESTVLREVCAFTGVDQAFDFETQERHNRAASPRSVVLTRLLSTANPLKGALKRLTPTTGRRLLSGALHRMNQGGSPPRLDPSLARDLRDRYEAEVVALERILGRDLSSWKQSPR